MAPTITITLDSDSCGHTGMYQCSIWRMREPCEREDVRMRDHQHGRKRVGWHKGSSFDAGRLVVTSTRLVSTLGIYSVSVGS